MYLEILASPFALKAYLSLFVLFLIAGIRYISNDRIGIVEKNWTLKGSVEKGLIALEGEAGFQPGVLRGGLHWLMPLQYTVHTEPLVTVPQGKLGYVFARDGRMLEAGQTLGSNLEASNFEDAAAFLRAGGQRGPQRKVLREGTYAINLAQFVVIAEDRLYFLRLFATVEQLPKTTVEVGTVGVLVSYTGEAGADLSGADYKHGELVRKGERGVCAEPLMAGKYAFNTYAGKVVMVPTTNFILKWIRSETGSHKFDENLSEVSLITKDAFEPSLPLSVVVHIDYKKAPFVIQRFGDIRKLVEQTLDPMVSAYFKNIGQQRTLIQLIQDRAEIQKQASLEMREKFMHYNLELEEVLIGTPRANNGDIRIEEILSQLRLRQIAEEQVETYVRQEKASAQERVLRETEARARQQQSLTESELAIIVQSNQGKADYQRSIQQAAQVRALAEAEADKVKMMASAEAEKAARVGIGQAMAIEEQVRAYGGPQYQLTQAVMSRFAEALQASGVDIVPKIVISGSGGSGGAGTQQGNVMEALMTVLLSEKMGVASVGALAPRDPQAEELRKKIREGLTAEKKA